MRMNVNVLVRNKFIYLTNMLVRDASDEASLFDIYMIICMERYL